MNLSHLGVISRTESTRVLAINLCKLSEQELNNLLHHAVNQTPIRCGANINGKSGFDLCLLALAPSIDDTSYVTPKDQFEVFLRLDCPELVWLLSTLGSKDVARAIRLACSLKGCVAVQ